MACDNCNTPDTGCVNCSDLELQMQAFCTDGCTNYPMSDCVIYNGKDIVSNVITIKNGDNLTKVIGELTKNNNDVLIALSFNPATRQICVLKNGVSVSCQNIPDGDDQYLALNGTKIEIWKPAVGSNPAVKINEIDLVSVFNETQLVVSSTSLTVAQSGTKGHTVNINLTPSTNVGNALIIGTDGKPYVPQQSQELTDVQIADSDCVTWATSFSQGKITITPTWDYDCIASHTCPICAEDATVPINLNVEPV